MIDVRKSKDKYKICNSCGRKEDVKEICYGRNKNIYNVFSLCEKCQMELMEKMWGKRRK